MTTNIATTTTYFVGAYYEVANGVVTKYYYAGSQRIAMRSNSTLLFLVGDHLGSTSLTTDASGVMVSELRYKAWGEVRYESGTAATKYTYTGQYSYTADFGLMFYNARWYDSSLSRFAQADTIMPGGIQGYDRYAYSNNNPIKYIDPSGHCSTDGDDWCHHTDTGGVWHIYNGPCANNVNCTRTRGTFARAGINYQKDIGCGGFFCGLYDRLNGHDQFDSIGPAQITDYEMEKPYGEFTNEGGHEQTGLGLRDGPCNGCAMDQMKDDVAMLANEVRLTLRLDVCVEHGCTNTDKVIVAALSIDEKINTATLTQAFTNKKYKLDNPTTTTGVDWNYFISDQMGADNHDANIRLIHRFTQEVQKLYNNGDYLPSDVNWDYITNTLK